jgi:hypothetical protein
MATLCWLCRRDIDGALYDIVVGDYERWRGRS